MNTENQNHDQNKSQNIIISIGIIILFLAGLFVYTNYYEKNVLKNETVKDELVDQDEVPVKLTEFNCGLTIKSPKSGQSVSASTGIDIVALLDNSERDILGCSWVAFEAQIGVVYVKDGNGNNIANPTPLTTTEEWMTDAPVNYFAHLNILNNYTGDAFIIINEENPSDATVSKTISFPLTITQ